jgi:Zn-dependent protease with chaperone function
LFRQPPTFLQPIDRSDPLLWGSLVVLLVLVHLIAQGVTWSTTWIALWPWRRSRASHWSELARLAYPARKLERLLLIVTPLLIAVSRPGARLELLPEFAVNCLFVLAGWTGVLRGCVSWARRINPAMKTTPRPERAIWISNWAVTGVVILTAYGLFGIASWQLGLWSSIVIAAGVVCFGAYLNWGWPILMRLVGLIQPAGERFRTIALAIGERMQITPTAVVELQLPLANAFAFIATGNVGATTAALAVLDDDELTAVCAHEMGHLSEPAPVRAVRLAANFSLGLLVATPAALAHSIMVDWPESSDIDIFALYASLSMPVIFVVGSIVHRTVARRMELRADGLGKQFEPAPGSYARALEKLYFFNRVPLVAQKKKHAHPELYDRLVDAGAPPECPRPKTPPEWPLLVSLPCAIVAGSAGWFAIDWLLSVLTNR